MRTIFSRPVVLPVVRCQQDILARQPSSHISLPGQVKGFFAAAAEDPTVLGAGVQCGLAPCAQAQAGVAFPLLREPHRHRKLGVPPVVGQQSHPAASFYGRELLPPACSPPHVPAPRVPPRAVRGCGQNQPEDGRGRERGARLSWRARGVRSVRCRVRGGRSGRVRPQAAGRGPSEVDDDSVRDVTEILTSLCERLYGRRAAVGSALRAVEAATGGVL